MSFTVEPGDGTEPLANSYASVAEFKAYWDDRGFDYTDPVAYTDPQIEVALVNATMYIDLENGQYFSGCPLEEDQPLAFPRDYLRINRNGRLTVVEGLPYELKYATFEYAKAALTSETGDLQPVVADRDETGAIVTKLFEKIGPIETETEYLEGTASQSITYPAADKWILRLLRPGSNSGRTIRN